MDAGEALGELQAVGKVLLTFRVRDCEGGKAGDDVPSHFPRRTS
jgi:hypothetical protein